MIFRNNSTRFVFKGTDGTVVSRFDYAPYGEVIRSLESGDLVSFTYTGQEMDKHLGVMNYNARLYDPGLSRFLSADPLREFHSPYNYVGNNPFSFTDPSGMVGESGTDPGTDPNGGIGVIGGASINLGYYADRMFSSYSASRGTGPMQSAASDAARVDMGKGFRTLSEIKVEEYDRKWNTFTVISRSDEIIGQ